MEWFPCTDPGRVKEYATAARGILSGEMRVVEYRKRGFGAKAKLGAPAAGVWQRIATWSDFWSLLLFIRAEQRVLQRPRYSPR